MLMKLRNICMKIVCAACVQILSRVTVDIPTNTRIMQHCRIIKNIFNITGKMPADPFPSIFSIYPEIPMYVLYNAASSILA